MKNVLLVDDDANVTEGLSEILQRSGYDVTTATSVSEAQTYVDVMEQRLDLCIVDLWLDESNGLDLVKALNSTDKPTPTIVISGGGPGRTLEQVMAAANALGAEATLQKPFTGEELLAVIDALGN